VIVAPEDGYGPVDPSATVQVPKDKLPEGVEPEVGMVLGGTDQSGQPFQATIREIVQDQVTLDLNHPLAGKELLFKVKVVDIGLSK